MAYLVNQTFSSKPSGTLNSENLFYKPPVPQNSQAAGMKGTDGRAYTRQVGQSELATTHLNQMLNSKDPYMQNARARGLQSAARRGLMNSSIAAGNAERSAIEAASPFAMQAADTYGRAQTENLGFLNQNLMQERDIANRVLSDKYRADAAGEMGAGERESARLEAEQRYRMFQENLAYEGEQRGLDRAHDFGLSDMDYRQQRGLNEQGYGFDLGRMNNQNQWTSRENDRDYYRNIGLQDNQYSNQRYNNTQQALLDSNISRGDAAFGFLLQMFRDDPSTSPQDADGFYQWATNIANQDIDGMIDFYMGGG
jgi:hypothetical protein